MNNRVINISLAVVAASLLLFLAFRVSFEPAPESGCCGSKGGGCASNNQGKI